MFIIGISEGKEEVKCSENIFAKQKKITKFWLKGIILYYVNQFLVAITEYPRKTI